MFAIKPSPSNTFVNSPVRVPEHVAPNRRRLPGGLDHVTSQMDNPEGEGGRLGKGDEGGINIDPTAGKIKGRKSDQTPWFPTPCLINISSLYISHYRSSRRLWSSA